MLASAYQLLDYMYVILGSYLQEPSLDLWGGTEISSVLNLTLVIFNTTTLILPIALLPTNNHLTILITC